MEAIRPITLAEAKEITQALADDNLGEPLNGFTEEEFDSPEHLSEYAYCVDKFMSGCPGYCGQVYIILWDGGPENITTLYRNHEKKLWIGAYQGA